MTKPIIVVKIPCKLLYVIQVVLGITCTCLGLVTNMYIAHNIVN